MNATLLAFNTVERLLKGDFFHAITLDDLQRELATLPPDWPVLGLGTTNWQERHGELLVEGTAGAPRFLWADPESDPPASIVELDATAPLPFAAVAAWDPAGAHHRWVLPEGADLHTGVADGCAAANVGLAAVRVTGPLHDVAYQVMCHIPIGGVTTEHQAVALQERRHSDAWTAIGLYAANPTIQAIVSHGVAAVHLHGRAGDPGQGGHLNAAVATGATQVDVWPLAELVLRIRQLDVAWRSAPDT